MTSPAPGKPLVFLDLLHRRVWLAASPNLACCGVEMGSAANQVRIAAGGQPPSLSEHAAFDSGAPYPVARSQVPRLPDMNVARARLAGAVRSRLLVLVGELALGDAALGDRHAQVAHHAAGKADVFHRQGAIAPQLARITISQTQR